MSRLFLLEARPRPGTAPRIKVGTADELMREVPAAVPHLGFTGTRREEARCAWSERGVAVLHGPSQFGGKVYLWFPEDPGRAYSPREVDSISSGEYRKKHDSGDRRPDYGWDETMDVLLAALGVEV